MNAQHDCSIFTPTWSGSRKQWSRPMHWYLTWHHIKRSDAGSEVTPRTFNPLSRKYVPCEWRYASRRRQTARSPPVNSSIFSPFVTRPSNQQTALRIGVCTSVSLSQYYVRVCNNSRINKYSAIAERPRCRLETSRQRTLFILSSLESPYWTSY